MKGEHEELIKVIQDLQQGIVDVNAAVSRLQEARQPSGSSLLSKGIDVKQVVERLSPLAALNPSAYSSLQSYMKDQSLLQEGSSGLETIVGTLNQMKSGNFLTNVFTNL